MSLQDEITRSYYRTTAARGHAQSREHYERVADALLLMLRPWLPTDPGGLCVDLACGCGETLFLLERLGYRQTAGVDLCREELEQAGSYVRAELTEADALEYLRGCDTESVALVTALNFLEHLPKDALLDVLRESRRVLKPGGSLIARVPNAVSPFGGLTRHWDLTHEWAFVPSNFEQLAALTGFDADVEFRECGPVPHGVVSATRYVLWQVLRGIIAIRFLIETGHRKGSVYTMDMLIRMRVPQGAGNR